LIGILKPCPFCGGEAKTETFLDLSGKVFHIFCPKCGVFKYSDSEHEALANWNKRTGSEANGPMVGVRE